MRRVLKALVVAGAALVGGTARGQEEKETAEERAQLLLDLIAKVQEAPQAPTVLGGIDLRTAPAETRRIARVLRETRMDLVVERSDVRATLDILRKVTGLNFIISARARSELETAKPELTLALRRLSAENILNLMLLQLDDFRFTVRHGAVLLVHKEEHRTRQFVRFHDVADLIYIPPDFPAPRLALGTDEEKR